MSDAESSGSSAPGDEIRGDEIQADQAPLANAGLDPELLEILACPETKEPVAPADPQTLESLNRRIAAGGVKTCGGETVEAVLQAGLLRQDGKRLYPVREGIPIMLVEEAIEL